MLSMQKAIWLVVVGPCQILTSIVVQYVLSGQRQILVCETATILFAFCGTSLKTSQSEVTVEECASTLS